MNAEIMHLDFPQLDTTNAPNDDGRHPALSLLGDIPVNLDIRLGSAGIDVKSLLALKAGSVVELDALLQGEVDVLLNGQVVAR
jgi:flagellar motor switch/type III secretory pathway protein FliN